LQLATLALGSCELALKLGAALIFLFGATLFVASLGPARPF
jgi:hypothetical protein